MKIKNENKQLTNHFNMLEYYHPKFPTNTEFELPDCFLEASEILREFFDCPVIITSTVRPSDSYGYHKSGRAVDYITTKNDSISIFKKECLKYQNLEGSELILKLRSVGITSFGIENSCIHIDNRSSNTCDTDEYGKYIVWSWTSTGGVNGSSKVYHKKC